MSDYTHINLKEDVDDQAPNFGLSPNLEARMARVPLGMENAGVSYLRLAPGFRIPFAHEFGTPLVAYCRNSVLARARAYARVDPQALVVYGTKAFPNVALLRLLAAEGLGADVSTLGELEFALRAGVPGDRLVFHGNNKSNEELGAAAAAGALVVLDALEEIGRAQAAGATRVLVRLTPGIEAETHRAIRTAHAESKFGLVAG